MDDDRVNSLVVFLSNPNRKAEEHVDTLRKQGNLLFQVFPDFRGKRSEVNIPPMANVDFDAAFLFPNAAIHANCTKHAGGRTNPPQPDFGIANRQHTAVVAILFRPNRIGNQDIAVNAIGITPPVGQQATRN